MSGIRLFYGSNTGNTAAVARMIQAALGEHLISVTDIADARPEELEEAQALILGISTWEEGAPQMDWANFLPKLDHIDLSGKKVALFGLGDAYGFTTRFVNDLRMLYDKVRERGGEVIGYWPTEGYDFTESNAVIDGLFVGLVIDQENASDLTVERVSNWTALIKKDLIKSVLQNRDSLGGGIQPPGSV